MALFSSTLPLGVEVETAILWLVPGEITLRRTGMARRELNMLSILSEKRGLCQGLTSSPKMSGPAVEAVSELFLKEIKRVSTRTKIKIGIKRR